MPSILFVCTANRFRSPLAAAIFRKALLDAHQPGSWRVSSAGTWASTSQPAIHVVQEYVQPRGLDLSTHRSVQVTGPLLARFDLVLVMEPSHKEALRFEFPTLADRIHLLADVAESGVYAIPDHFRNEDEIEEVFTLLQSLLLKGYRNICNLAEELHSR